jgi:hypothetical protein
MQQQEKRQLMELTWFRADTSFAVHDKITALVENFGAKGKQAGFVYMCALGHSVGHGTDGLIKRTTLKWVHGTAGDASILVQAELWETDPDGWRIKNFGTRQIVGATQQIIAEQKAAAGKKGADKRWGDD